MSQYARGTTVTPERSRDELARLLQRYGVKRYVQEHDSETEAHAVTFELNGRWYRVGVDPPELEDFTTYESRGYTWTRSAGDQEKERYKEFCRRWRVMILLMKAKLEAISDGTVSAEYEMMPYLALPDGGTLGGSQGQEMIEGYYSSGRLRGLLPGPS